MFDSLFSIRVLLLFLKLSACFQMEGMKAFKRTLHAGKGKPIDFVTGTKAFFHYEAKIPRDGIQGFGNRFNY